jgi:hypothetical protein
MEVWFRLEKEECLAGRVVLETISGLNDNHSAPFAMKHIPGVPEGAGKNDYLSSKSDEISWEQGQSVDGDKLLHAYLSEIQRYEVLNKEEQMALAIPKKIILSSPKRTG